MTKLVIVFNWHFFLVAVIAAILGFTAASYLTFLPLHIALLFGTFAAIYFIVVSVIASYFVYDHSDLYKLNWWSDRVIPPHSQSALLVHAGFDPASRKLMMKYSNLDWTVLDFFDPSSTTETSIRTARKLFPPVAGEQHMNLASWPTADRSQDIILMISAAHEIRNEDQRSQFFREAERTLKPSGRLVVIEQLRDLPNFVTFGAAFLHFLSQATWIRSFKSGGLRITDTFRISPWMKAFVLRPNEG